MTTAANALEHFDPTSTARPLRADPSKRNLRPFVVRSWRDCRHYASEHPAAFAAKPQGKETNGAEF
jgi:hypothetical protein